MGVPFNSSLSQVCRLVLCTLIVKSLFCLFSFLHAWANLRFVSYTLPCTGLPIPRLSLTPPLLHGVMEGTRAQKRVPSKVLSSPAVVPPSPPRRPHSLTPVSWDRRPNKTTQAFVSCPAFRDTHTGTSSNSYRRSWIVMREKKGEYDIPWECITRGKLGGRTVPVENWHMNVSWLREGGPTDIFPCELVCVSVIISGFSVFHCARAQIGCSSQEWKIPTFLFFENPVRKNLVVSFAFLWSLY